MNRYEGFVGKVLDNRYKILELVGMGGMACVLKAQDLLMNRIVAIKILNDEYNGDEQAEARFIDESKAVAMLSNKNIVSVYDVAIYPDIKYIVMEFLDGITLREYLDNKGAIDWKEACIYTLQTLRALEHAHSKGIIHRDIKPQNVILTKNGDIKVTDFGIAKLPNSLTEQKNEKAIGTVYYISPEQACGKETDYYSDIYSIGIMLYEAVTGTLPFTAETPMEVAMMQVNDEPVNPRDLVIDIPIGVAQIILKAMEKSPSDRFASAHTMAKAIEWVLRNPGVIFSMAPSGADEVPGNNGSVISIDMIDTAELVPYDEKEMTNSLPKKKKTGAKNTKKTDKKTKKKRRKSKASRTMFPIISGVSFAFLLVAVVLAITIGANFVSELLTPEPVAEVEYPNLVGTLYSEELRNELRNGKYGGSFVVDEVIDQYDDNIENNCIVSTEPPAGHLSKPGEDGKLHFTSITINHSQKVYVPYLEGYTKTIAQTMLSKLELNYVIEEMEDAENPYRNANQVISTYPVAGSEVNVGETITLYVCKNNEQTRTGKMPNVIGMTPAEALKHAQTYALYTVEFRDSNDEELVIEQHEALAQGIKITGFTGVDNDIKAGDVSEKGTVVILYVEMPIKAVSMPNLRYFSFDEATLMFDAISNDYNIEINAMYYVADEEIKDYVDIAGSEFTDLDECVEALESLGCKQAFEDDGTGIIYYQSIQEGEEINEDTVVTVIVVRFTTESGGNGEESNPGTSEGGNDESSEVVEP